VIACRRFYERVGVGTVMSLEEYMRTSFHPDCDFVDGEALERSVGERRHSYAQGQIVSWFNRRLTGALTCWRSNRCLNSACKWPRAVSGFQTSW
jgi:hypothetical protein